MPVQSGIDTIESGIDTIKSGIDLIQSGVDTIESGIDLIQSGVDTIESGIDTIKSGVDTIESGIDTIKSGIDTIESGIDTIKSTIRGGHEPVHLSLELPHLCRKHGKTVRKFQEFTRKQPRAQGFEPFGMLVKNLDQILHRVNCAHNCISAPWIPRQGT